MFWTCNHCEYESTAKTTLNGHSWLVYEKRKYECDNCEYEAIFESVLKDQINIHIAEQDFDVTSVNTRILQKILLTDI